MLAALSVLFYLVYAIRINLMLMQKTAKVVVVTRIIWAVNNVTIFVSMIVAGEFSLYFLVLTINCILIAILSFRSGSMDFCKTNVVCAIISLVGIVFGVLYKEPFIALLCSGIVSVASTIPMYKVLIHNPKEEDLVSWLFNYSALWCATLSLKNWNFSTLVVPILWIVLGTINITLLCRPRKEQKN
jgi:hypothetical protein